MGSWIKMSTGLQTHPKVVRIASALNADKFLVIGALHWIWSIFDEHSEDGFLEGYDAKIIDDLINLNGFAGALLNVGWLAENEKGLYIPRFTEHNGASAKRRAEDAKRKKNVRKKTDKSPEKRRPDKIRIDNNINNKPINIIKGKIPISETLFDEFKKHRIEIKKPLTAEAEKRVIAKLERFVADGIDPVAAVNQSIECGWSGIFPAKLAKNFEGTGEKNGTRAGSENSHSKHAVEERV